MLNRNFKKKYNVNLRSGFCILVYPFAPRDYGMYLFDKFSWKTVIDKLPKLVIVSFILMALMFDSRVIMWGEIVRGRSL